MREYIPYIKENGIDGKLLSEIINQHKLKRAQMMDQYERYKASVEGVPILDRHPTTYDSIPSP